MVFLKNNRGFVLGFSMGFGAGLVAREMVPATVKLVKPTAKMLLLNGLTLVEKVKEGVLKAQETLADLTAEVDLELKANKVKHASKGARPKKVAKKLSHD